jgi:hypothetical protein
VSVLERVHLLEGRDPGLEDHRIVGLLIPANLAHSRGPGSAELAPVLRIVGVELDGPLRGFDAALDVALHHGDHRFRAIDLRIVGEALVGVRDDLIGAARGGPPQQAGLLEGGFDTAGVEAIGLAEVEGRRRQRAALEEQLRQPLVQVGVVRVDLQGALELDERVGRTPFGEQCLGSLDVRCEALLGRCTRQGSGERQGGDRSDEASTHRGHVDLSARARPALRGPRPLR